MTNTAALSAALEEVALGIHRLALAVAADSLALTAEAPDSGTGTGDRRCECGGAVTFQEWTSRAVASTEVVFDSSLVRGVVM